MDYVQTKTCKIVTSKHHYHICVDYYETITIFSVEYEFSVLFVNRLNTLAQGKVVLNCTLHLNIKIRI